MPGVTALVLQVKGAPPPFKKKKGKPGEDEPPVDDPMAGAPDATDEDLDELEDEATDDGVDDALDEPDGDEDPDGEGLDDEDGDEPEKSPKQRVDEWDQLLDGVEDDPDAEMDPEAGDEDLDEDPDADPDAEPEDPAEDEMQDPNQPVDEQEWAGDLYEDGDESDPGQAFAAFQGGGGEEAWLDRAPDGTLTGWIRDAAGQVYRYSDANAWAIDVDDAQMQRTDGGQPPAEPGMEEDPAAAMDPMAQQQPPMQQKSRRAPARRRPAR